MAALPGRAGDDPILGEQAALRRVATLVARAAPPEEVFGAVTEEAGRALGAQRAGMTRYDPDGAASVVASWSSTGAAFPVGARARLGGRNLLTLVFQTGRAARIDDYADASGPVADAVRDLGFRTAVGVPVSVEGRLWGGNLSMLCAVVGTPYLPRVQGGMGTSIVSTSTGVMTGHEARAKGVGGEVVAYVW